MGYFDVVEMVLHDADRLVNFMIYTTWEKLPIVRRVDINTFFSFP